MRSGSLLLSGLILVASSAVASAAEYQIDPTHSFVQFRVQHLGYSWLHGRFNNMTGNFKYDAEKPADSAIEVTIETTSVDSNHAERDKHLRSADFLNVVEFPKATFKSTAFKGDANGGTLSGVLALHGVEKAIDIAVKKIGEGKDPWGGYRAGFSGTYVLTRKDFGLDYELGPASTTVELELGIEGIRQ